MRKKIAVAGILTLFLSLCGCGENQVPKGEKVPEKESTENVREPEATKAPEITDEPEDNKDTEGSGTETDKKPAALQVLHPVITECNRHGSDSDYHLLMSEQYPQITLSSEEESQWSLLAKTLKEDNVKIEKEAEENFREYYEMAKEFFEERGTYGDMYFSHETDAEVMRADSAVLSVRNNFAQYTGGVHGYYAVFCSNYDTESGKKLKVSDVVTDMNRLTDLLAERLMESYSGIVDADTVKEHLKECAAEEELFNWLMDYDGITFYFNPETLSSYAAGMQTVRLSFEEYPGLFAEKYTAVPENFIVPVFWEEDMQEKLKISYKTDEYNTICELTINLNGVEQTFDMYCYEIKMYMVHTKEGDFLYAFCRGDNDFEFLQVYDLNGQTPVRRTDGIGAGLVSQADYRESEEGHISEFRKTRGAFTDSCNFNLTTHMDALSSVSGWKNYYVGADGLPQSDMTYYDVSGARVVDGEAKPYEFTTLAEMDMNLIGEDMSVTDQVVTVPAGSRIQYLRTDNEKWADFQLEDGRIVRAGIFISDYPQMICGIELEKALNGTMFAG